MVRVILLILKMDGKAFCKGIFVKDIPSFFSYNFQDAKLNPDRNEFFDFDTTFSFSKCSFINLEP